MQSIPIKKLFVISISIFAVLPAFFERTCEAGKSRDEDLRILAAGDSITAAGYPSKLRLQLEKSGISANVVNMGIPGATSGFYLEILSANKKFLRESEPCLVLIMLGANDSRIDMPYEGPAAFKSNINDIIKFFLEELRPDNPPMIMLSTVMPVVPGDSVFTEESLRRIVEELNPVLTSFSRHSGIPLVDNFKLFNENMELLPDGVHPGREGSLLLAENWLKKIKGSKLTGNSGKSDTALIYSEAFLQHDTGKNHPESPARLKAVIKKIQEENLWNRLIVIEPEKASPELISLVHCPAYIKHVEQACKDGDKFIHSPDTAISKESYETALYAAGGVIKAIDGVMQEDFRNAFCAVRPPGHHALRNKAMGFCLFNNIAIGASYLLEEYKLQRVAIIDWDVHHGNGTQDFFYEDPRVFFASVHQHPFYPGTGAAEAKGSGAGEGLNLNIPLPAGAGDMEYIEIFKKEISPALVEFNPEFILVSAGFDAHADDPLGGMKVSGEGFARLTRILKNTAEDICEGRIVSVLEGGYNLEGLSGSVKKHLKVLME